MNDMPAEDRDLDRLLLRHDPASAATPEALDDLVEAAFREGRPRRLTRRGRIGLISTAAIVMVGSAAIAGVTIPDFQLHNEPYQTVDDGSVRGQAYIKVTYPAEYVAGIAGSTPGTMVCHLYPEFRGLSDSDLTKVDAYLRSHDFTSVSADATTAADTSGTSGRAYSDVFDDALFAAVVKDLEPLLPGVHSYQRLPGVTDESGPEITAWAQYCGPELQDHK